MWLKYTGCVAWHNTWWYCYALQYKVFPDITYKPTKISPLKIYTTGDSFITNVVHNYIHCWVVSNRKHGSRCPRSAVSGRITANTIILETKTRKLFSMFLKRCGFANRLNPEIGFNGETLVTWVYSLMYSAGCLQLETFKTFRWALRGECKTGQLRPLGRGTMNKLPKYMKFSKTDFGTVF